MTNELEQAAAEQSGLPQPDPALRLLDRFVGTWTIRGHLVGSDKDTITGEATYQWLPGGFFLEQRIKLDFMQYEIESVEFIGYDPETGTFPSTVFSNMSPVPLPYRWEVEDDRIRISVSFPPLDATFEGTWSEDRETFAGGWRPNPGADETVNVAYDVSGHRVT
ncbi:MAG TPA: DUF1579 family protein [Actinomycetota bacterium]|nr:DUF1579 family protein [Actinomycetota bacterium]